MPWTKTPQWVSMALEKRVEGECRTGSPMHPMIDPWQQALHKNIPEDDEYTQAVDSGSRYKHIMRAFSPLGAAASRQHDWSRWGRLLLGSRASDMPRSPWQQLLSKTNFPVGMPTTAIHKKYWRRVGRLSDCSEAASYAVLFQPILP